MVKEMDLVKKKKNNGEEEREKRKTKRSFLKDNIGRECSLKSRKSVTSNPVQKINRID